jgi:adenylate kinase family enzyme
MGKAVLLTGAPGVGKTTLRKALAGRFPALQEFDYGKLLLERKAAEGVKIEYPELREKSSSVISPADVGSVDDWVIQRVNELRQHSNVILDPSLWVPEILARPAAGGKASSKFR